MVFIPTGHGYFDLGPASGGTTSHLEASWNGGAYTRIATVVASAASLVLTSPANYQLFQRSSLSSGSITITGTLNGVSFSGSLSGQPTGQGTLTVRVEENHTVAASATVVGIGESFACAGQSNMGGRVTNSQSWSSTDGFTAVTHENDGAPVPWNILFDPYDEGNSWLPLFATLVMNRLHVPVAIMPGPSHGGSSMNAWQPGADHLDITTYYGHLNARMAVLGSTPRALLVWDGETDAENSVSQSTFHGLMSTFIAAIWTDRAVPTMFCKLQVSPAITPDSKSQTIRDATAQGWGDIPHALIGPDFSDQTADDGAYHFTTNANALMVAQRWANAVFAAFFPSTAQPMTPASVGQPVNASYSDLVMV
jgi:hypothetical protein